MKKLIFALIAVVFLARPFLAQAYYDPVAGQWLSYDPAWNDADPSGQSFCGGDPVNGFDSNGKCVQNTPPAINFGILPQMANYLETTTYLLNGNSQATGLPGENSMVFDPSQVAGYTYNKMTLPTGNYFYYSSANPIPDSYGQASSVPVTQADVQAQQGQIFLSGLGFIAAVVASDGLAADATLTTTGAENALNGVRLNQQLSAQSAFNASGGLSQEAINGADQIFAPGTLGNPAIPSGFGKFTTQSFDSPSGPFQVHFYQNPTTGEIWTGLDYKTVFNNPIGH